MSSPFDALCGPGGPLRPEPTDAAEFNGLMSSGEARLADAKKLQNSLPSRFDLAYNAAHALCLAALRRAGYRSSRRYIVFQVLPLTLGLGPEVWRVLDRAHNVRNRSEYEGDLSVDERLLASVIEACERVASALRARPRQ
ncbi:hypothetical protein FJ251_07245 [bacterium]|nr:hypothetical protein [bacterium]